MPRIPVSVFIITRNESDRLPLALESVRSWVDETVVIDSGSEDDTCQLAREMGASVLEHPWSGYGPQKIFGEQQCKNPWILNIDADEEVSPELKTSILALFENGTPKHAAYRAAIQPLYPFQEKGHPWTISNHPLRLYHRDHAGFHDSPVHDAVIVRQGTTGKLDGALIHRSFRSLAHHIDKVNAYSDLQAEDYVKRGRTVSALALVFLPPLAFLKSLILRREFINGVDGIVISYMYAFQRFARLAKARERLNSKNT